ncbi:MAG: CsgG/HfaB family protein, partial [Polyangia bacterium]
MKRAIPVALAALSLLAGLPVAHATTTPVVAVMPFKDLSGARGSIGEAIRETVTTDLKGVPGLRVIERGDLDQVLAEQNLQARKADLDPLSTVKVGKLLGASLIVAGAYQRAASSVRLTARFVRVETGEIVGTAKVDGRAADFLSLQDKVTVQLLRSAGLRGERVQLFAKRVRPKLKSLKTIELYGDAVVEKDDKKKEDLLKLALNEDPGFVYASRDLDELEKRLKRYDTAYQRETDRQLQALLSSV